MSELIPCPFCKSQNVELSENDRGDHAVYCKDCRAEGPPAVNEGTKEEAVCKWNKRGCQWTMKYKIPYDARLACVAIVGKVQSDYPDCNEVHVLNEGNYFEIIVKGVK